MGNRGPTVDKLRKTFEFFASPYPNGDPKPQNHEAFRHALSNSRTDSDFSPTQPPHTLVQEGENPRAPALRRCARDRGAGRQVQAALASIGSLRLCSASWRCHSGNSWLSQCASKSSPPRPPHVDRLSLLNLLRDRQRGHCIGCITVECTCNIQVLAQASKCAELALLLPCTLLLRACVYVCICHPYIRLHHAAFGWRIH